MGWIKKFISAPIKVAADIVRVTGDVLLNSNVEIVWKIGLVLDDIADKIEPKCYKEDKATGDEICDFEAWCTKHYNIAKAKITPQIEELINNAKEEIADAKRNFQCVVPSDIFQQIKLIVDDNTIEEEKKDVLDSVAHTFSNDNKEFLEIVEIESDKERKEKSYEYITQKIGEICSQFKRNINDKKNSIIEDMCEKGREYYKQQENYLREIEKQYDEMLKKKDEPEFVNNLFSEKAIDVAYSKCILSLLSE